MTIRSEKPESKSGAGHWRLAVLLGAFCLMLLRPVWCAGEELSFNQAMNTMMSANERLLAAREEKVSREEERRAAYGLYLPEVSVTGRWTRIDDPIVLDLDPIRSAMLALHPLVPEEMMPHFKTTVQDETFFKSQLNAKWPVLTGGRILAVNRATEAATTRAEAELQAAAQDLTTELARYYFGLRLAEQVVTVRAEALAALAKHLYQARRMEEMGLLAAVERLHAEVAWSEADRELKAARHDRDIAGLALGNLLAAPGEIQPTTPLFISTSLAPLEEFLGVARGGHPTLEGLAAAKEMAHQKVRVEASYYSPEVYLFAMHELHDSDLTILEPRWAAGVGMNITLFSGLQRYHKIRAARHQEEKIRLLEEKAARDLQTLVKTQYERLIQARERFESLETSLAATRENLRARQRAFEEGLATSLDVVDARLSLSAVQVERVRAAYDYDLALAGLLQACGRSDLFPDYLARAEVKVGK
jgi:outer membrane protein TolC